MVRWNGLAKGLGTKKRSRVVDRKNLRKEDENLSASFTVT